MRLQAQPLRISALAASIALALAGCATPVLQSSFEPPPRFAAAEPASIDPDAAWWEGFGDPVLSDLIRRAAHENRDVQIAAERVRAARAGETISRSSLFPAIGASVEASSYKSKYDSRSRAARSRQEGGVGRARRVLGDRSGGPAPRGREGRRGRHRDRRGSARAACACWC